MIEEFNAKWPAIHRPVNPHPLAPPRYGADTEPKATEWMTILCASAGEAFQHGMTVLDYGCGAGRLANFISQRTKDFIYYGIEPATAGPYQRNRMTNLDICNLNYGGERRIRFGAIGSVTEREALDNCTLIVAGSVFTHLAYEEYLSVLKKFKPALKRGAPFVHSLLIGKAYELGVPKRHGIKTCYSVVTYSEEQVAAAVNGFKIQNVCEFYHTTLKANHRHQIMVMTAQ